MLRRACRRVLVLALSLSCPWLGAVAEAWARGSHRLCVSAELGAEVVLPDGSRYEAGSLEICESRIHSPVASLHETRIDGRRVGIYASRSTLNEQRSEGREPYMVFDRGPEGELVLTGYAVPDGERMRSYRLRSSRRPLSAEAR